MGDKGSKDKGKREKQKKAQRTPKAVSYTHLTLPTN